MRNRKEDNTGKTYNTTWGNKPKSAGERRKIKEISIKDKTIQTKQDIPKQRKKILPSWEEMTIKYTNNQMQKKPNDFGQKYGNQKT